MQMVWLVVLAGCIAYIIFELFNIKNISSQQQRSIRWANKSIKLERQIDEWISHHEKIQKQTQAVSELLKRSRLRLGGKPLNKYLFFVVLGMTSVIAGYVLSVQLNNFVAGVLISVVTGYLFFHFLSWDANSRKRAVRKMTPNFFLTLINFYEVHQDALLALKDTAQRIKNPLRTDLEYFITQLQNGDLSLREAIVETKQKLDNKMLQDFLDDFELQIRFGGNFTTTLQNYVNDSIEKEIQIMERSSETAGASMVTYFLMGVFFMLAFTMKKTQPAAMEMLVTHIVGKVVVVIIIAIMLIVLYVTKEMTAVNEE
ncbi:hypothetical protein [Ferviditalea candida]|uniref:Type II secretion system protein GspF domain-containing protein n=1 Tax=Ferviditalea candida TaxID=3108399 RepID=A0ABU5ZN97_9BACL|nr:hypothetical protein [Paenibacillaceae bacterium T2]